MKIDELKEGDWILYKGKPAKIIELDKEGSTRVKMTSDFSRSGHLVYGGYTREMLNDMKPFTPKCKDCNWFHDFYCRWRLQAVRIEGKSDNLAYRNKNDSCCNYFSPTYNFIQKYTDK